MNLYFVIIGAIYALLILCYFITETGKSRMMRAVNKTALSSMYLSNFVICFFMSGIQFDNSVALCLPAFLFCFLADIVLIFDFVKGAIVFSVGNICFTAYSVMLIAGHGLTFRDVWWCVIVFVAIFGGFFVAVKHFRMDYSKYGIKMPLYLFVVTLHGSLGTAMAVLCDDLASELFGLGLVMFMISDYLLVIYKIHSKRKLLLRTNSGMYFVGIMLASMSFWLI